VGVGELGDTFVRYKQSSRVSMWGGVDPVIEETQLNITVFTVSSLFSILLRYNI